MSETKWTPGKWVAIPDPNACAFDDYCVGVAGGERVDEIAVCSERNARLIAAAPELYEALKMVSDSGVALHEDIERAMLAALAKAKGE